MKYHKSLLMLAFACLAMAVSASPIDAYTAQTLAERSFRTNHAGRLTAKSVNLRLDHVEQSTIDKRWADFYVFNADDGSAFVVVAGDDRVEGVLAYGERSLDMNNLPCGVQWWLDGCRQQIEYLHSHPSAPASEQFSSGQIIEPLLISTWSPGAPYNDMCPVYRGHRCVTGCVATAMAQVMYYWKFPAQLSDLPGYTSGSFYITMPDLPPTMADWDNMLEGYSMNYTPAQGAAVATLMLYCGQASTMDYSPEGSGSTSAAQLNGLRLMGYNLGARCLHRQNYEDSEWHQLMIEELTAGRPILYTGHGDEVGHAFVIDGYDGNRFHINWGWEGVADGYFALNNFAPAGNDFTLGQQMLNNVYPKVYGVSSLPYDFEQDGICYKVHGSEASVVTREYNYNSYSGRVVIPATVTHDGMSLPVTSIGNNAFNRCTGLTSVVIPQGVKSIGNYAFNGCTHLTSITLPTSVSTIGYAAFYGCTALSQISLGSVRDLGYYAFAECVNLTRLTLPGSVRTIGDGAFMLCSRLASVNTGNGVASIGEGAFAGCLRLKDVVMGNAVKTVGNYAFLGCKALTTVTFGLSVETIGEWAFEDCNALVSLTALPEMPPLIPSDNCFPTSVYKQATLYVPRASGDDYVCCDVWTLFDNIVVIDTDVDRADVNHDGEVNIADINAVIEAILQGGIAGDVNNDGEVNIADINAVINRILYDQ